LEYTWNYRKFEELVMAANLRRRGSPVTVAKETEKKKKRKTAEVGECNVFCSSNAKSICRNKGYGLLDCIVMCSSETAVCFGGTFHFHLQGRLVSQTRKRL
jgi:hypothetical protein